MSCKKDSNNEEDPKTTLQPISLVGNITISSAIPSEKIGTLKIVSGFFENPVTDNSGKSQNVHKKTSNDISKTCQVETLVNTVQLHTITNNGLPMYYGLSINATEGEQIPFNEETTAISLIFLHRLFIGNNPATATIVVEKIKNSASFPNLVSEIKTILLNGHLNNQSPYIETSELKNYTLVVAETLNQLNENKNIEQNGLQIFNTKKVGSEIHFQIRNSKKRYSTIYAHEYKGGQLLDAQIKVVNESNGFTPFDWVGSGEFSWVQAWYEIFTLDVKNQIIEDSPVFAVEAENAEKIYIKCYGLGVAGNSFPEFGSKSFIRGSGAMAMTSVFDYALPLVSLVTGINDFPQKGSLLRGRPADHPLRKLVERWAEKFVKDNELHTDLQVASSNNDVKAICVRLAKATAEYVFDPENVKSYFDLIKQSTNMTAEMESKVKNALDYVRIVKAAEIAESSVNLGEAIYATFTTKWETEFIIDKTTGNNVSVPTDGLIAYFPFNGNANDESVNHVNGTVNGNATLTSDRNENINSAYLFSGSYNDYIATSNSPVYNLGNNISICAWVKPSQNGGYVVTAGRDIVNGSYRMGDASFFTQVSYSGVNGPAFVKSLPLNEWSFMVGTLDGTVSKFYLNGVFVNEATISSPFTANIDCHSLMIGRHSTYCTPDTYYPYPFAGSIDDVRLYNRALTENEVKALYNE